MHGKKLRESACTFLLLGQRLQQLRPEVHKSGGVKPPDRHGSFLLDRAYPFYTAASQSLRAVMLDEADHVYLAGSKDGVLYKRNANGTVLDASMAAGLGWGLSQVIARPGVFHGSLFVACNDPVNLARLSLLAASPACSVTRLIMPVFHSWFDWIEIQ
ncbi:MAG: hypothetical protein AMXMBFR16_12550 [Candidatus Uhrbacteria bacterium]